MKKMMATMLVGILVLGVLAAPGAVAGKKKKKKPKPWTSEEGTIGIPHTMLISSTNERNNVTLREFENRCAIPATNGLDGYVYEVPEEYQTIQSNIAALGVAGQTRAFYVIMYDDACEMKLYLSPADAIPSVEGDTKGIMPAGIAYLGIANFFGHPAANVTVELKP